MNKYITKKTETLKNYLKSKFQDPFIQEIVVFSYAKVPSFETTITTDHSKFQIIYNPISKNFTLHTTTLYPAADLVKQTVLTNEIVSAIKEWMKRWAG